MAENESRQLIRATVSRGCPLPRGIQPENQRTGRWSATGSGRCAGAKGYLADFSAVRRQRVQAMTFVVVPFWVIVKGWRFGW